MVANRRQPLRTRLFIKEWMNERGLSDEDVAQRLADADYEWASSAAGSNVWRWANEQNRLNPEKIAAIAQVLDLEPEDLWRPPGRRSLDAILAGAPDELIETATDVVTRIVKGRP